MSECKNAVPKIKVGSTCSNGNFKIISIKASSCIIANANSSLIELNLRDVESLFGY